MSKIQEIKNKLLKRKAELDEAARQDWQDFLDHPLLYTALVVSGFLSALAGLAIGLGLQVRVGNVYIKTDFPHLFFAVLYAVLFPYFFEFGLANWLHKLLEREPENKIQKWTAISMVLVTGIGTAITAFSAMDVLVTTLGFFASFQEIPVEIQRWIAYSLPGMLMVNIASGELYRQNSETAVLEREALKEYKEARIEADNEIKLARMEARKNIALHAAAEYERRSREETVQLGARKGERDWNKDREKYQPNLIQYAADTDKAEKKQEHLDPTRRQSQ